MRPYRERRLPNFVEFHASDFPTASNRVDNVAGIGRIAACGARVILSPQKHSGHIVGIEEELQRRVDRAR
jgi:hypothetical protein